MGAQVTHTCALEREKGENLEDARATNFVGEKFCEREREGGERLMRIYCEKGRVVAMQRRMKTRQAHIHGRIHTAGDAGAR